MRARKNTSVAVRQPRDTVANAMLKAILLLCGGLPPLLALIFGPGYLLRIQDELLWRIHRDPIAYLKESPGGWYRVKALEELDRQQRAFGLIGRLKDDPQRLATGFRAVPAAVAAAWSDDGSELVTVDGTQVYRWRTADAKLLLKLGERGRRQASHPNRFGFGFNEVALLDGGQRTLAMTSGPHSLWTFPSAESGAGPLLLEGDGYETLTASGGRAAMIRNLQYGLLIDTASNRLSKLPHDEIVSIGFAPNADIVTVSSKEIKWWRGEQLAKTLPLSGATHPSGLSANADLMFAPGGREVQVWDTASGAKRFELAHKENPLTACSASEIVATGTEDGFVHLWSTVTGQPIRSFRAHQDAVTRLYCSTSRLLSVSTDRGDSRLWDLSGRSQVNVPDDSEEVELQDSVVRIGADLNLTNRFPGLTSMLLQYDSTVQIAAAVGIGLLGLAAHAIARRARSRRQPGSRAR